MRCNAQDAEVSRELGAARGAGRSARVGDPGVGKTNLLAYFTANPTEQAAVPGSSTQNLFQNTLKNHTPNNDPKWCQMDPQVEVQIRPKSAKISFRRNSKACSEFGGLFGPTLGKPMCSKYSK